MVSVAALIWGLVYLLFGEPVAAAIPLIYAFFSLAYIIILGATYRYRFFRLAQYVLTTSLPFLLMLALGGYINGSAVIVWAFLGPVAALLGGQHRQARYLFIVYLALLILSGLLQPILRTDNNLPEPLIIAFFVVNLATLSAIALGVIVYFVRQQDLAMQLMQKNRDLEQAYLQQEIMLRQSEKLATLGRLSAGMAHELNNPASAAQRGAEQLRDAIPQLLEAQFELGASGLSESQLETLATLDRATAEQARRPTGSDALARADPALLLEDVITVPSP
jgi:signal transduction histidine kinase